MVEVLNSERFVDLAPAAVYSMLLDEGTYLCSIRTLYRILAEQREVRARLPRRSIALILPRHPRRHPPTLFR